MKRLIIIGFVLAALAAACGQPPVPEPEKATPSASLPACDPDNGGITLPDGFLCAGRGRRPRRRAASDRGAERRHLRRHPEPAGHTGRHRGAARHRRRRPHGHRGAIRRGRGHGNEAARRLPLPRPRRCDRALPDARRLARAGDDPGGPRHAAGPGWPPRQGNRLRRRRRDVRQRRSAVERLPAGRPRPGEAGRGPLCDARSAWRRLEVRRGRGRSDAGDGRALRDWNAAELRHGVAPGRGRALPGPARAGSAQHLVARSGLPTSRTPSCRRRSS